METGITRTASTWFISCAAVVIVVSCATSEDSDEGGLMPTADQLCLGGTDLWLGYQNFVGMGIGGVGETMLEENGFEFFVIDGACRFWVLAPPQGWSYSAGLYDVMEGTLTAEEAARLVEALEMDKWDGHRGSAYYADALDCGGANLFDAEGRFSCGCGCPDFPEASRIFGQARAQLGVLADFGTPVGGVLRVMTQPHREECEGYSAPLGEDEQIFDAPPGFDPLGISIPACDMGSGVTTAEDSVLVEGALAAGLRGIRRSNRDRLLRDEQLRLPNRLVLQLENGQLYDVWLRDFVPLEDDEGFLDPHRDTSLEGRYPAHR